MVQGSASSILLPDFIPSAPLCAFAETMSASQHMREAPSTPLTETLGSSSNQSAIRRRLLWATEDSDYPRVTGGIFSICAPAPLWLA